MNKVARITASFWVMKICATTLGETAGDLLSMTLKVGYAVSSLILLSFFLVTLTAQVASRRFHPFLFWMVILSTSTAGTTMSDYMDRTLELGYAAGSAILLALLFGILLFWRVTQKGLSVNNIQSRSSELLYWSAILISNTLGTALGDFLADDTGLGFFGGAGVIGGILMVILAIYRFTTINRVFLFWCAFVLTRPFGATCGDLLTKSREQGGFNLGTIGSSAVLGVILLLGIIISSVSAHRASRAANQDAPS